MAWKIGDVTIQHFNRSEFRYPDDLEPQVVFLLNDIRADVDEIFTVTSDGRDPVHNAQVGGSPGSLHVFDRLVRPVRKARAIDWVMNWAPRPVLWVQVDKVVGAWYRHRDKYPFSSELELVFSPRDKHFHLGLFPDQRPHRLVVAAD